MCMCVCVFVFVWVYRCVYAHSYDLTVPFQARDTPTAENAELHAQLEEAKVKIHALQQHLMSSEVTLFGTNEHSSY